MKKKKTATRIGIFFIICGVLFLICNYFYKPAWKEWNNYDTVHGFYEEPENTIETLFLGASVTVNGIIPIELYREYGICAYNLGTEQQPLMTSYYWLLETERLHKETLDTVVLDASMLRRTPIDEVYQKSLDGMKLSKVKLQALMDYTENINDVITYLFPALEYHSRWSSIDVSDYEKKDYSVNRSSRGYNFVLGRLLDKYQYDEIEVPEYFADADIEAAELDQESLYYLKKIIEYSEENHLKLVIMKTPGLDAWSTSNHNAVKNIAKTYDLDFIDFNYEPYISEIKYNEATDSLDGGHLNYYGAKKVTNWIGKYLIEECNNKDIQDDEKYSYMQDETVEYDKYVTEIVELQEMKDVTEYLGKASEKEENVIFITVKDDASDALTEVQRKALKKINLVDLSSIGSRASYIGIIDGGKVVYEEINQGEVQGVESKIENDLEKLDITKIKAEKKEEKESDLEMTYLYKFDKNKLAEISSGGMYAGNQSSCLINGEEYSKNERGMNIVIYSKKDKKVIDSRTFDTCGSSIELSRNLEEELKVALEAGVPFESLQEELQQLYLYNENSKK